MSDIDTTAQATADAAQALTAAQAGYSRRKGMSPAPAPQATVEESAAPPLAEKAPEPAPAASAPAEGSDEPHLEAEPAKPAPSAAISAQLDDVKAQIRELKANGVDASTVHRLFGEIGGITRVVKQLQARSAPTESELAGALKAAEKTAEEYPEIGGPMVAALKALAAQIPAKPEPSDEPAASAQPQAAAPAQAQPESPYTPEQRAAIKFLDDLHPDRLQLNAHPEFKSWLSAKPADFQQRFTSSWDFAFIAKGYGEFKAAHAAKQQAAEEARRKKTERLEAAVTPQGSAASPTPTNPSPEALALRGYNRYRSKSL
jgi:hypothetical protein